MLIVLKVGYLMSFLEISWKSSTISHSKKITGMSNPLQGHLIPGRPESLVCQSLNFILEKKPLAFGKVSNRLQEYVLLALKSRSH